MLKKTFVIGAAGALLLGLVFGRSHVLTTVGMVKQQVRESVPIDFEIKRARQMIKDLHPEIEQNMRLIAQEEVEVSKLARQVDDLQSRLAKDRTGILRLKDALETEKEFFVFAGNSYSAQQVKADLASRFKQFKTEAATTEAQKKILRARETSLQAAREKLDGMLDAKRQLEVDVENLEARLAMVEVAQTTSDFRFDDSHLARTKELIESIGTRIEVAEKLVNADMHYFDRIPLDEEVEVDEDISDEITKYFGEDRILLESYADSTSN